MSNFVEAKFQRSVSQSDLTATNTVSSSDSALVLGGYISLMEQMSEQQHKGNVILVQGLSDLQTPDQGLDSEIISITFTQRCLQTIS